VVGLAEVLRHAYSQVSRLHSSGRILEHLLANLLQQELADAPGVQLLHLVSPAHPLRVRTLAK